MKQSALVVANFFLACVLFKPEKQEWAKTDYYRVYKIDSLNNYYFIYARKGNGLYKIVSKKESIHGCDDIRLNGEYPFVLSSLWTKPIMIGNVNVSPSVTPHVTCLSLDGITNVCLERDSINDIFVAKNIKGLCVMRDSMLNEK